MEMVTRYLSTDGIEFPTEDECVQHENLLAVNSQFKEWYEKHPLYVGVNGYEKIIAEWDEVLGWIRDNVDALHVLQTLIEVKQRRSPGDHT